MYCIMSRISPSECLVLRNFSQLSTRTRTRPLDVMAMKVYFPSRVLVQKSYE
jgi:hypothetical protein